MNRQPRIHNEKHLKFIRQLPCVLCMDNTSTEAAHVRMADRTIAKQNPGIGAKPDDKYTLPLCGRDHRAQHQVNEEQFWIERGIDPVKLALALYSVSGDYEAGERIVYASRAR